MILRPKIKIPLNCLSTKWGKAHNQQIAISRYQDNTAKVGELREQAKLLSAQLYNLTKEGVRGNAKAMRETTANLRAVEAELRKLGG